jgi:lipopolysaccharide biosynthesis regulator YciM
MTYLFLGNLYQSNGEREKALEIWRDGLELFPDSQELRSAVELAEGSR